jgi:hypothetical protein
MTEITLPTPAEITASRVRARLEPAAPESSAQPDIKATTSVMRARAIEDATELGSFVETIAEHFKCAGMVSDEVRMRLKSPFQELRAMARRLNAEAARAAVDPTAPTSRRR